MKKVLLVTIQDNGNFGNRLQNYALQTVLERMEIKVDNLTVYHEVWELDNIKRKNVIKRIAVAIAPSRFMQNYCRTKRIESGIKFTKNYIHGLTYVPRDELDKRDWSEYHCAVVGSDQVWHNWHRMKDELSYFYLSFIPENKRVAYAPSFGFEQFPEQDVEEHKKGLSHMRFLSCRENEGCDIIHKLVGKTAEKVLDPTLLLDVKDWEKIERKPAQMKAEKFVFCFFIGEVTEQFKGEIRRICDELKLEAFYFNDLKDPYRYQIAPQEFVWLIHHADAVCTDSFHASVFSILYGRKLRVFERKRADSAHMFGRLRDLLRPLGLMKNVYDGTTEGDTETELTEEALCYLSQARESSLKYLTRAIKNIV